MSEVLTGLFPALADRYRIERELGAGGMATVYLARDLKHDRDVAVKVLRPELAAVLGTNRFLNEIKLSARLDHPHILTLIDSGAADGVLYYVMPFVRGESLRDRLRRDKQLPLDEAFDITRQITSALDYAHRQGIVHRDIKPENILLHEGEAMLADFGIAMAVKEAGGNRLTESGVSLGTPQYMSPEQATGDRELDARSDIYSIAAVLYEMLAGEPPHTGATVQAVVAKLLTERPTRLRVLRDTVPDGVDAAVAKALAKLPADRYASAGDFARALTTAGALRRPPAPPRRGIRILVGGVATVAAIIVALLLSRKPAPLPLPDRVQLTVTGNAVAESMSPDGVRVAFGEKVCNEIGSCTYQLVIKDTDGPGRKTLTQNIGYIYKTQWTADGRFVAFAGSYPPTRHGTFAVSTLGGETRFIGCCYFHVMSGDTSYVHMGSNPGSDRAWVRRITIHDGQTIDSIPVRDSLASYYIIPLTIPNRLIVAFGKSAEKPPQFRLTDFDGRVIDTIALPFASLGRAYAARWVPAKQRLYIASQRELAGTDFDLLTMTVSKSKIGPDVDTVLTNVPLGNGIFDVSPDGERLIYDAGPVATALSTVDLSRSPRPRLADTQLLSSTARLRARMSPAGDKIILARDAPGAAGHASQFSLIPRGGGAESHIPGTVENLVHFEWSPDGTRVMYLHAVGGDSVRLMERDTTDHPAREITKFDQREVAYLQPLADGAACTMPAERRSISIIGRPGKSDVTLHAARWLRFFGALSPSPDAKSLAFVGMTLSDSVVVGTVEIESGVFTEIETFAGSDPTHVAWLADGSIMFIFREPEGAWVLYSVARGRPAGKIGFLPHKRADFTVSNDGRYVAMFSYTDKSDVYMIRNFGKLLRE